MQSVAESVGMSYFVGVQVRCLPVLDAMTRKQDEKTRGQMVIQVVIYVYIVPQTFVLQTMEQAT